METGYLADHKEFLPTLARWHHQEWAYLRPGDTLNARTERLRAACGHAQVPTVFVAFSGAKLLGSSMLIANNMDTRTDLSPWLAGVFVRPDQRKTGIGAILVQRVVEEARSLGIHRLYLYTLSTEQFYARLGWSVYDHTHYHGVAVVVMTKEVI